MGFRSADLQIGEVDHIHICSHAHFERASIFEAIEAGVTACLFLDQKLDWDLLAPSPVSCPMGDLSAGHRPVTDQLHVCTSIAEAGDRLRMHQHLPDRVQILVYEAGTKHGGYVCTVTSTQEVIRSFERCLSLGRRYLKERLVRCWFVIDDRRKQVHPRYAHL